MAAVLTTVLAFPVAWVAVRSSGALARVVEGANYITSSLPGIVTALALVTVAIHFARPLYQTVPLIVFAYVLLFMPRALVNVRAGLAQVPPSLEEASRSLGSSPSRDVLPGHPAAHRARRGRRCVTGIRRCGNGIDRDAVARAHRHQDVVDAVLVVLQRAGLRGRSTVCARAGGAGDSGDAGAVPAVDEGGRAMTTMLDVRGLGKSFNGNTVLDHIDLSVAAGSTTAVVGSSGCGKTTLLRLIAGFETPDAGTVTISGRQVASPERSVAPHRRSVGYVAQDGALFPHLTVGQNIAYGLPGGARSREVRNRVAELLETVSLDASFASRRPHQLSGGQQQRVALARALARKPVLMLLDEPFSALDTGLRASTRKAVARLLADAGVTTLLVTHDQEEALSIADQIAVMRDGRFTQVGAPQDVYRQPNDRFTAEFLGDCIALPCTVASGIAECALGRVPVQASTDDGPATLALRPEQLVATVVSDSAAHVRSRRRSATARNGHRHRVPGTRRAADDRPRRRHRADHRATAQPQPAADRRQGPHRGDR